MTSVSSASSAVRRFRYTLVKIGLDLGFAVFDGRISPKQVS
jgi:hypothetical protein